jgi:hypothetical protein
MLPNLPRTQERAIKIDIHQPSPSSIRVILCGDVIDYARCCDQDIDLAKVFDDLDDGGFNL